MSVQEGVDGINDGMRWWHSKAETMLLVGETWNHYAQRISRHQWVSISRILCFVVNILPKRAQRSRSSPPWSARRYGRFFGERADGGRQDRVRTVRTISERAPNRDASSRTSQMTVIPQAAQDHTSRSCARKKKSRFSHLFI